MENPLCPLCRSKTFCNSGIPARGIFTCRNKNCKYCFAFPLGAVELREMELSGSTTGPEGEPT